MVAITDSAFRQICKFYCPYLTKEQGADVVYSEMVNAVDFIKPSNKPIDWQMFVSREIKKIKHLNRKINNYQSFASNLNQNNVYKTLEFTKIERPYIVQIYGNKPKEFALAAKLITEKVNPDGIDLNFHCQLLKVIKHGAGGVLMDNLKLAREIIKSVLNNTILPVSIKIRICAEKTNALKFLDGVSDLDIKAVMIHNRGLFQHDNGKVDWKIIKNISNYYGGIVLANGGVKNVETGQELLDKTKAGGLGIARGALGRPWIFQELKTGKTINKSKDEIIDIVIKHAKLAYQLKGEQGIVEMRKHLCWYVQEIKDVKVKYLKIENIKSVKDIILALNKLT